MIALPNEMDARLQKWLQKLPRRYKKYRQPPGLWSMTIPRELAFCESYARECFSGRGRIIDLGCWFGATTFSLARGLKRNWRVRKNRVIEAFDLFVWTKWMDPVADQINMPRRYGDGESFYQEVERLLEPYKDLVLLHEQDLMKYEAVATPVELLFVDAMKTWPLAKKIVTDFFPCLIPGTSVVVQQDFVFHKPIAATSHLLMWRLRDHFDWLHQIPRAGSVAFVCKKKISAGGLPDLQPESFSLEEIDQAYEYSRACVPEEAMRPHIDAAKLLFLIEFGYYEAALQHARWLLEKEIKFREHVLADARALIAQTSAMVTRTNHGPTTSQSVKSQELLTEIASLLPAL
jgi:hypothetical protein